MPTEPLTELERFHRFVGEKLNNGGAGLSVERLLALWRERQENVRAIQEALDDMEAGDTGRPLDEVMSEIRRDILGSDES